MFYALIASIKLWFNKYSFIFFSSFLFYYLGDFGSLSFSNLIRFISVDIIPYPIKASLSFEDGSLWFLSFFSNEIVPGLF